MRFSASLHTVVLSEKPEYEALSYAWGDPNVTEEICVDGFLGRCYCGFGKF